MTTTIKEANGIDFVVSKPDDDDGWPRWTPVLDSINGAGWIIKPEHLWYHPKRATYLLVVNLNDETTNLAITQFVAAKWLRQRDTTKDEYLVCVRPRQPFRWSCVRHFFKKNAIPFYSVKNPDTGLNTRMSAVLTKAQKDELEKVALIYQVGRPALEQPIMGSDVLAIMTKYGAGSDEAKQALLKLKLSKKKKVQ